MTYVVNEIFYSMQGEGLRAGEMSIFIRFTGCNLKCRQEPGKDSPGGFDCDTEFVSGTKMTDEEILGEALFLLQKDFNWRKEHRPWIVFTGGEPSLQLDKELVDKCHEFSFRCAIETNGSRNVDGLGLDWITVSPKVAEHAVRQLTATEIKYVRGYGQGLPKPSCLATYKLLSPAFKGLEIDSRAFEWCQKLISENPDWRLSIQQHKGWKVR